MQPGRSPLRPNTGFTHCPHSLSRSLLEEGYVMKDPFTPDKDRFLILGSRCSVCSRLVCVGPVGKPRATGRLPSPPRLGPTHLAVGEVTV